MTNVITSQAWYQEKVLSCPADIVIWWWQAGAGKTFSLLLDPLRLTTEPKCRAIIFRRTTPQIKGWGWLWDNSVDLYPSWWWTPIESKSKWTFKSWAEIAFSHMEYEKDKLNHQGLQYAFIWFDELTHFTKTQFLYLLTRNRSISRIKPYIRCTCNPDSESWVKEMIEWYLDEDGFIDKKRDWIIRFFTVDSWNFIWWETKQELIDNNPHIFQGIINKGDSPEDYIKSFTFIEWNLDENEKLLKADPTYKANLMAQDEITKKALLYGCWNSVQDDLALADFTMLEGIYSNNPTQIENKYVTCDVARFWKDLAVIITWTWWIAIKIQIFKISSIEELYKAIEQERASHNIPIKKVLIDEDWIGWWLVDRWNYIWFKNNWTALNKENYQNLKTQCYYRMIQEQVNTWEILIMDNFYVDWEKTNSIQIWKSTFEIRKMIIQELKAIKRANIWELKKKSINSKDEQKNILWRSPDFWDSIMMRKFFDLELKQDFFIL